MKHTRTQHATTIITVCIAAILVLAQPLLLSATPVRNLNAIIGEDGPAKKSGDKVKAYSSRNNGSVKIYPDALKKMMHVVAKANKKKEIDFFVFDMEGTMMRNYKMKAKEHVKIQGLQKGSYLYRVFCGDEETASGNFIIN
jgi:hypothetical protein